MCNANKDVKFLSFCNDKVDVSVPERKRDRGSSETLVKQLKKVVGK